MISKKKLAHALRIVLPADQQNLSDGRPRTRPTDLTGTGRVGSVLLLLYVNRTSGSQQIVLTLRRKHLSNHPGQISLPGGRQEPGEQLQQTALRETLEEIGVVSKHIEIVGKLTQVYIPPSDYTITPFVGWAEAPIDFEKSEDEVEEILMVDLAELLSPDSLQHGPIDSEPEGMVASFYAVSGRQVWGATAVVLHELTARIRYLQEGERE